MNQKEFTVTADDGVVLAGTATIPENPKAIIIPVHGSFPQTRDGNLDANAKWMFPHGVPQRNLFVDIASTVYAESIATYRYDKRASGSSGGSYKETDMDRLAKDVIAVAKYAKEQHPKAKIVLLGQSEGGLTVLRAHELGYRPDEFFLQGPSLEPLEVFLEHQKTRAAASFLPADSPQSANYPYLTAFYRAMYQGDMLAKIQNTDDVYYTLRLGDWSTVTNLKKYRQYRWNGSEMLKSVKVPVTIVYGQLDPNVRPEAGENIARLKEGGKLYQNVEVHILPHLEHSFREVAPGDTFVSVMGKPVSPAYLDVLRAWAQKLARNP